MSEGRGWMSGKGLGVGGQPAPKASLLLLSH